MIDYPQPGTFIRPVGRLPFSYCYEVAHAEPTDDLLSYWEVRLWHLDDSGQPSEWPDEMSAPAGHPMRYLRQVVPVAPGVYRDTGQSWGRAPDPLYFRRIDVGGQLELFA